MNYYLSLENCRKLKEWGCDVESEYYWERNVIENTYGGDLEDHEFYAYDFRDIICNGELAKKFFGEDNYYKGGLTCPSVYHVMNIIKRLHQNKEEVEEYFMQHTIFNPLNK